MSLFTLETVLNWVLYKKKSVKVHLKQILAEIRLREIKVNTFIYKVAKEKQGVTAGGFPVSHSEAPVQTGIELRFSFILNGEQQITSLQTGEFINPGVQD